MTRLSYLGGASKPVFQALRRLARTSLFSLGITPWLAGCLVAEPPSPSNPERTPPMIDFRNTFPLVTQITPVSGREYQFSVNVRSEDRGADVFGLLYLDYSLEGEEFLTLNNTPASTFDDTDRQLNVTWSVRADLRNCHQITMLVTHAGSFRFGDPPEITAPADVALATWWVHINPGADDFGVCPKPASPP